MAQEKKRMCRPANRIRTAPLVFLVLLMQPRPSYADAISPLTNLFTRETAAPAAILTISIIVIEAFLLRRWMPPKLRYRDHLWRAGVLNIASSAAGSLILIALFGGEAPWDLPGLFVPMFLLTLAVETPLLWLLYRSSEVGWVRTATLSFGINLVSYAFVLVAQVALVFVYFGYANIADGRARRGWNDESLLAQESGLIYTVDGESTSRGFRNVLKRYDVTSRQWTKVDIGADKRLDPSLWDVRGKSLVVSFEGTEWPSRTLEIIDLEAHKQLSTVAGIFREVRVSPDESKVATLEYVRQAGARRDKKSYFMLGSVCKLKVFDLNTGTLVTEAGQLALDNGLSWSNDSTEILFTSLRDQRLFEYSEKDFPSHGYGRGYAKAGQFPIDIYSFDIGSKRVTRLVEGEDPRAIASEKAFSFLRETGGDTTDVSKYDISTGHVSLLIPENRGAFHAPSPSGKTFLVHIPHKQPLGADSFLTALPQANAARRLILQPSSHYDFRWVPDRP